MAEVISVKKDPENNQNAEVDPIAGPEFLRNNTPGDRSRFADKIKHASARYVLKNPVKLNDVIEIDIKLNGEILDTIKYVEKDNLEEDMPHFANIAFMIKNMPQQTSESEFSGKIICSPNFTRE